MNILLTVEELAKYLKVKPDTIYKKVRKGELPAIKLGKLVRFPKDLIDQWLSEHATKTLKEFQAAKTAMEAKIDQAVIDVKKTAQVASKAATKVMGEVPELIEEIKKAPLNKKNKAIQRGLKTLWKDFNHELHVKAATATTKTTKKRAAKKHSKAKTGSETVKDNAN